ncbi:MAG TPA: tetratricopeptide repeat protein [Terriglobia bacterium]|nr:tetratricopeptide repeat protein [Terriglobia bacterium]
MSKKRTRKAPQPKAPPPPPETPWVERLPWQIGALAVLVLLAYVNSLDGKWVYDDENIFRDSSVTGSGFGRGVFALTQARPLTFLTFHWNFLVNAGHDPASWHAVNILLHAANCALLLLVARRHLSSGTAFVAAALYAVHPLNTEAVSYVYQRSTALATLFALLSFLLFLKEQYAWSVGAFGLSLLCKEETIALPVFLLLYDLVYRRRRPLVGYYAAMLGLVGLAMAHALYVWSRPTPLRTIGYRVKGVTALTFALTEPRVIWAYIRLFLFPTGLNVDHDVPLSHGLLSPASTLPALLTLAALVGLLGYLAWRQNQLAFWGLGFFILLAPTSSIVPVRDVMFEHRVYFPSTCLVIAAAGLLALMPRRALAPAVGAILIVLTALTIARNRVWQDGPSLWTDAIQKSPRKSYPYATMGRLLAKKDPRSARQYFERAATLEPDSPDIQNDLGVVLMMTRDGPGAVPHLQRAVVLEPDKPDFHTDLGVALLLVQDNPGALEQLQRSIALGGANPDNLTYLGEAYGRLQQLDQAVETYRHALTMDPCMGRARSGLVRALNAQGKGLEAAAVSQTPPGCRSR